MTIDQELYDRFKDLGESLGMTGRQLEAFAGGQLGLPAREGFDGLVDTFRATGLTEAGAKAAAIGQHGDERAAREYFDTPDQSPALHDALDALALAYERFHGFTSAEAVSHARGEAAKLVVTYNLTAEDLTGRVRELASTLNATTPGAASAAPAARATAMAASVTSSATRVSPATVAWHREQERRGAARRAGVTE